MNSLSSFNKIPCTLMRGGTSKGVMFLRENLPVNDNDMFNLILKLMGAPDVYGNQMQGLGNGKSTNNKVGIIKKSTRPDIDVDYLFCQVNPNSTYVYIKPNCGNFISAVPLFAIYKNLVNVDYPFTKVRIFNENTEQIIHANVPTSKNGLLFKGNTALDGVTGLFPSIELDFFDVVGSKTGKLLPTTKVVDIIDGVRVSCLDISVPMVIINGDDLNIDTNSDIKSLKNIDFLKKLQNIRQKAATIMNLGDVSESVIPKVAIICKSENHDIKSFYYDPFTLHDSHAVTGAMCISGACLIKGTVANEMYNKDIKMGKNLIKIEHQQGIIESIIDFDCTNNKVHCASFIRTASLLMDGFAFSYEEF